MAHIINKLQLEVTCTDEEQAFGLRHHFAITYQEQIAEVIDKICSKYVSDDEWLKINKFVIDLGRFTPNDFESNFVEVFKNKFAKELTEKLSVFSPAQKNTLKKISAIQLLQYFLINGHLPWWAGESIADLNELVADIFYDQPVTLKRFLYENRFSTMVWNRIAYQLNDESKALIVFAVEELQHSKKVIEIWLKQISIILKNSTNIELKTGDIFIDMAILKNVPEIFSNTTNDTKLIDILKVIVADTDPENESLIKNIIETNKDELIQTAESFNKSKLDTIVDSTLTKTDTPAFNYPVIEKDIVEKIPVKHAGIILLAPFFKNLFINLELSNGIEWNNKDTQYKAFHMLWFLSTGTQKTFEYNLTLEKILCGIPVEEPVPVNVLLQNKEINEAELLLASVIEHWKAIKNTSINGLRETFLKRDGLLKKQEGGWLLQVERKTLDVLVESIPWGYSTISLPWNNYLISVEW